MNMRCSAVFALLTLQVFVFALDDDETLALVTNLYFYFSLSTAVRFKTVL